MILAVDGASTDLSAAIATPAGEPMAEVAWTSEQRQSAELLPRVLELLAGEGRGVGELGAIAVGTGPGSFTGLRVAMALAKGLAAALDRPIVGIPSLGAWLDGAAEGSVAVARAGAREAYVLARGDDAVRILDRDALSPLLEGRPIVAPTELAGAFALPGARPPRAAAAIARLAARRLADEPRGDDRARLEPIYLRAPRGVEAVPAETRVRWL